MKMDFDSLYSDTYTQNQLNKFFNRHDNHWAPRIKKVFELVNTYYSANFGRVLDLGTSIGTYAYEFSERGFEVTGIDLSDKAIDIARKIAGQYKKTIKYVKGDISERGHFPENYFDIIYAGDIIEHLEDRKLQDTLDNCFYWLKPGGIFIFHTVPTKYDIIFHKSSLWIMLSPFFFLPDKTFKLLTQSLYGLLNISLKILTGLSWKDRERRGVHCNLQTREALEKKLKISGFSLSCIELTITEERFKKPFKVAIFGKKEYFQKDIFGVAIKSSYKSNRKAVKREASMSRRVR